jgi:hypothetical protein
MSSLNDIFHDHGASSVTKAQVQLLHTSSTKIFTDIHHFEAHLTLLRMFCAVYDGFGTLHPGTAYIHKTQYTPEQSEIMANYYLIVAHIRYRLYLDLLVSVRDTPKESWPVPPWYITNSAYQIRQQKFTFQGMLHL